ncbi:hypothetical protein ACJX0J_037525, partial [Zea mays]
ELLHISFWRASFLAYIIAFFDKLLQLIDLFVIKHKARLVAKEYAQHEGSGWKEVYVQQAPGIVVLKPKKALYGLLDKEIMSDLGLLTYYLGIRRQPYMTGKVLVARSSLLCHRSKGELLSIQAPKVNLLVGNKYHFHVFLAIF